MIDLQKSAELNGVEPIELYARFKRYSRSNKRVICYCEMCGVEREVTYHAYCDLCHTCANGTPEKREKMMIATTEYFSYQENRDSRGIKLRKYYKDHPEVCEEKSIKLIEHFSHQENRDAQAIRLLKYNKDHPEAGEEQSIRLLKYYKDHPDACDAVGVWIRECWEDSEWRESMIIKIIDSWDNENRHDEMSDRMSKHWGIEENREKMSATKQGVSYDEWEDYAAKKLYCPDFNDECRESNREKYNRRCFLTGLLECKNINKNGEQIKLAVHHVDMDKGQGCDGKRWKLVPLCMWWHGKVHNELWEARIIWLLDNVWNDQKVYIE